jgi:predicted amidohydrolase
MPAQRDDATADAAIISGAASADAASAESQNDAETAVLGEEPGWEGDGTTEIAPDDSEWCEVVEIDLTRSENVRRWWPFLRDRRIDSYNDILRRFID